MNATQAVYRRCAGPAGDYAPHWKPALVGIGLRAREYPGGADDPHLVPG